MVTDKLTVTHQLLEELSKLNGKAGFMPANEIGLALQYLEENGIPNQKNEDYKYCNIEGFIRKEFKTLSGKEIPVETETLTKQYHVQGCYNIYIVNGKPILGISEIPAGLDFLDINTAPAGILKKHLANYAKSNDDAMVALNTAYADRGFFMQVNSVIEKAIVIHHITSAENLSFYNIRNLFIVEKNAQLNLVEIFHPSAHKSFQNTVTEIFADENTHINHTVIQNAGETSYSVNTTKTQQHQQSVYTNHCFTFSGALVRNNLNTAIDAEFAEANLFGLFITNGTQLVDNHTFVDHLKPNCQSNELYKGIAAGKSTAVFNGQIFVERDAQKTNAYQSSKNILLSDDATVNAKPELEIYANDVKCSHGTSTGKVDEDALFYLKARGIGEETARKLLLQAFAHEIIEQVNPEAIKDLVTSLFEKSISA